MKKALFVLLFSIGINHRTPAQQPVSTYFEQAYAEISAMLDGRDSVNLKRAVFLQEWAYLDGNLNYKAYCCKIDSIAASLKGFIALNGLDHSSIGGNIALFEFFSNPNPLNGYKSYDYDFDDYRGEKDYTKHFVTKLMRTHTGQCRTLPLFYKILANEIGAKAYIAYAPNHSFIRHRDEQDTRWMNVELTNHSMPREVFIIETMGITQEAIDKGTYLKPCEDREVVINVLVELALSYLHKFDYIDPFVWKCLETVYHFDPQNLIALMTANDCLYRIASQHRAMLLKKGIEDDEVMQHLKTKLQAVSKEIDATGYTDMPKHLYDQWLNSMQQEIERRKQENEGTLINLKTKIL